VVGCKMIRDNNLGVELIKYLNDNSLKIVFKKQKDQEELFVEKK